jgi:hypothetical protein
MLEHGVMDTTDTLNPERLQLRAALLQLPDALKTQMNEGLAVRYLCCTRFPIPIAAPTTANTDHSPCTQ